MRDVLGLAAAVLVGLLTLIVEPWSGPWWAGIIIASIIATLAILHMVANALNPPRRMGHLAPWILIIGGPLMGAIWLYIDQKSASEVAEPRLPISITAIDEPTYAKYSGLSRKVHFTNEKGESKDIDVDPPMLGVREIFISTTARAVTLRISLIITNKDGKTHKRNGDGRNAWGDVLGVNDLGTKMYKSTGAPPHQYLLSPVSIPPNSTVHGSLAFVISEYSGTDKFDEQLLHYYVEGSAFPKTFSYKLEIEDVVSGITISIPLPSKGYKGF